MRILVTGAAGFIGSHIADAYKNAGHEVAGVDNLSSGRRENLAELQLWEADLADEQKIESIFREFRPQIVSHHAAQVSVVLSWEKPLVDARVNILGSLVVLQQAVKYGAERIIYSSSGGAVYGEPASLPVTEDHPVRPSSNYGASKYATELYLHAFQVSGGLRTVILRYPNIYGPRQSPKGEAGVVAIFTHQLLHNIQPHIFGDGSKTRDYLYVADVVDANLRALDFPDSGVFNLGWGKEISDLEVFHAVREAVGSTVEPVFDQKRPGEVERICLDASRARRQLGWTPTVAFREGVRRVVEHWKKAPARA